MAIKNKNSLITENSTLYDEATAQTQEVIAAAQKGVTNDQIDSFDSILDRVATVSLASPLNITLNAGIVEQFFIDLTTLPGTIIFEIAAISGVANGQTIKIQIKKNADQAITFSSAAATGPDILFNENFLKLTSLGSPSATNVYGYIDAPKEMSLTDPARRTQVFVDSVAGNDLNDGLISGNPVKTDNKAYELLELSLQTSLTILRKKNGTYTLTQSFTFINKELNFVEFGSGTTPVITHTNTGSLTLSGSLTIKIANVIGISTDAYFKVTTFLDVYLLASSKLEINGNELFQSSVGGGLGATIRFIADISTAIIDKASGSKQNITDIFPLVGDVSTGVGGASGVTITNFTDNTPSEVFNVRGNTPIFLGIFTGISGTLTQSDGIDRAIWTVTRISVGRYRIQKNGVDIIDQIEKYTYVVNSQDGGNTGITSFTLSRTVTDTEIFIFTGGASTVIDKDFSLIIYKNF